MMQVGLFSGKRYKWQGVKASKKKQVGQGMGPEMQGWALGSRAEANRRFPLLPESTLEQRITLLLFRTSRKTRPVAIFFDILE